MRQYTIRQPHYSPERCQPSGLLPKINTPPLSPHHAPPPHNRCPYQSRRSLLRRAPPNPPRSNLKIRHNISLDPCTPICRTHDPFSRIHGCHFFSSESLVTNCNSVFTPGSAATFRNSIHSFAVRLSTQNSFKSAGSTSAKWNPCSYEPPRIPS